MRANLAIILLMIVSLGTLASCDLTYRGNAVHPDYPGQCYYEELKQAISKNQFYKPINRDDRCESIRCRPDFVLEIEHCGRHNLQPTAQCVIEQDMRQAYPQCCPKLVCQTDSNDLDI